MVQASLVAEPNAWRGADCRDPAQWTRVLSPAECDEVRAAVAHAAARGVKGTDVRLADFPLPHLGAEIPKWAQEINHGRGFLLVSGRGLADLDDTQMRTAFWGLGLYMGEPLTQNSYGDLLGDVLDEGVKMGTGRVRGYRTNQRLRFHTDRCDIVGLLCLHAAKRGGMSSIVSSTTIYNEMVRNHPEYLPPMYEGYPHASTEEGGEVSTYRLPVYSVTDGIVSCRILRNTIESARTMGYATHTELEAAALAYMDGLAEREDMRLDMDLARGDMQFINNYTTLHSRTEFEDHDDGRPRRHMLRLWLRSSGQRRHVNPEVFKDYNGVEKTLQR